MFASGKDNKGRCAIDLSTPQIVIIHEAYTTIKAVVWLDPSQNEVSDTS
jgi:hypothetical protein